MDQRAIDWGKNRTTISIERHEQLHAAEKERDEMADEIKQLRMENALLHKALSRYKTPNVDNIEVNP